MKDVLNEAAAGAIPFPTRPTRYLLWVIPRTDAFLATDWANPNKEDRCWKVVPGGPDEALPGDVLATGYPVGGHDGTGHVGIVTAPSIVIAPTYNLQLSVRFASAASAPPYWWLPAQKGAFIPGTITLTDYGFRLAGFDPTDPLDVQGLKQDSTVRRFQCY